MILTNKFNIPEAFCRAIDKKESEYSKGDADYSATGLLKSTKIAHLTKRHWKNIKEDYHEKLNSWIGSLMHKAVNDFEGEDILSERMYGTILGKRISGEPDHYNPVLKKISDYKYTGTYSYTYGSRDFDYEAQLNTYAWLYEINGFPVNELEIVFFFKDWKQSEAQRNKDYPQNQIITKSFPKWDFMDIESYLADQVMRLEQSAHLPDDEIEECSPEDRWEREPKYAVLKVGNKKATKSFDTIEEAQGFIDQMKIDKAKETYEIHKRGGEPKRCLGWCSVREYCHFGKTLKPSDEEGEL